MKKLLGAGAALVAAVLLICMATIAAVLSGSGQAAANGPSGGGGLKGVPDFLAPWITKASAACKYPALTPALLAAQLYQESGFNPKATSPVGAEGVAQFMPGTYASWAADDVGDGHPSPWTPGDAVMAQGRFMCWLIGQAMSSGITGDVQGLALAGYNAGWGAVQQYNGIPPYPETQNYVKTILANMPKYEGGQQGGGGVTVTGTGVGADAVRKAATQLGVPYSYGGGSPSGPSTGFCDSTGGIRNGRCMAAITVGWDCSSLAQYAYWPTVKLPRTASEQYAATSSHPVAKADLQVGDLLFWANSQGIHHVALYAGNGTILEAPQTGDFVKYAPIDSVSPSEYYGATRPTG